MIWDSIAPAAAREGRAFVSSSRRRRKRKRWRRWRRSPDGVKVSSLFTCQTDPALRLLVATHGVVVVVVVVGFGCKNRWKPSNNYVAL